MNSDDTAHLLERLLDDPGFRARFRHDPAAAAREAGVAALAQELDDGAQQPLEPLETRESRSSVAGVMLAAAAEGLGLFALSEHAFVEDALAADTPPKPAVPQPQVEPTAPPAGTEDLGEAAPDEEPDAAAPDESAADAAEPDDAAADEEEPDEEEPDEEEPDEEEPDEEEPDEEEPDEEEPDDSADTDDGADSDTDDGDSDTDTDTDDGADTGSDDDQTANESPEPTLAPGSDWKPDPSQYGMAGGGGTQSPFDVAVLKNSHITLDANGKEDFTKGRMDPRIGALLLRLAEKHELTLSSTTSDHPEGTAGGSTSNHWFGRALDIATVDGEIVRPGSGAARKLAEELGRLDDSIRPTEIGSPWAIDVPGSFSDADHQDHIHIAFDGAIARNWAPANEARVMPALQIQP